MREVLVIVVLFAVASAGPLGACEWDENMLGHDERDTNK